MHGTNKLKTKTEIARQGSLQETGNAVQHEGKSKVIGCNSAVS